MINFDLWEKSPEVRNGDHFLLRDIREEIEFKQKREFKGGRGKIK